MRDGRALIPEYRSGQGPKPRPPGHNAQGDAGRCAVGRLRFHGKEMNPFSAAESMLYARRYMTRISPQIASATTHIVAFSRMRLSRLFNTPPLSARKLIYPCPLSNPRSSRRPITIPSASSSPTERARNRNVNRKTTARPPARSTRYRPG
ncbi:hypothetical protein M440DRAFT_1246114 [Trichoderma longibrachiatum ATCC 18648]|uniref:Uncharacterized protein n=1 Tax=Trichoderma longibrachiatum ATCC 18648 TaxID=983965 RepID=A0A2T4C3H0_TRILO|nr:hypothetical protein M440DRAFT_1246114 [Trichoderma longibrachiatum ATCC 18648]